MTTEAAVWPLGASVFTRLRLGVRALRILQFEPDHPVQGPLFEWCMDSGTQKTLVKTLQQSESGRRILATRPTLQGGELDLGALQKLPAGSLGHEFFRYFESNGIAPFLTTFPIDSDDIYLAKRYRETHDLLHVLTGYPTHMLGEMELQAFVLGNLGLPSAAMILLFSLGLRLQICGFKQMGTYFRRLHLAYQRGQASQNLMAVEFEKFWERSAREVSTELIAPAPEVPPMTFGIFQAHKGPAESPVPA